jgi:hypothetical protein
MKCKVFNWVDFNEWAAGKPLARDVIIKTHVWRTRDRVYPEIVVVVIYDEKIHPDW